MSTFSNNLKRLREAKEWTQLKLARKSGIHVAQVSHYENGRREPNLENLRALKEALGCEYGEFFKPVK